MVRKRKLQPELGLSQNFRLTMIRENLKTGGVAEKAGVSVNTVSGIINQHGRYGAKALYRVGRALGFDDKDILAALARNPTVRLNCTSNRTKKLYMLIAEMISLFEEISKGKEVD